MSYTISEVENHLVGLSHGGTLNKVRNKYQMMERAANNMLSRIRPLETMRTATLANTVHDNQYNYSVPSDYRSLVGLYPQANRNADDKGNRVFADAFDRTKSISDKQFSIEGDNAGKVLRIDWSQRTPKTLHNMNTYDGNGTWAVVATATNIATDTIFKYSGGGSVQVDLAAASDGIQITDMDAIDLTDEDEIAHLFVPFYIKDSTDLANLNSVSLVWGNDLTTNYWTGVAQTAQADGTAFRVGWNLVKIPWSTATETGTVDPTAIDSLKVTFDVDAAITNVRVDNIVASIGFPFEIKYYSKYLFQTSAGVWINQPTTSTDVLVLDNDAFNIFLYECLDEMAHQVEGEDSGFDMQQANKKLWGDPRAMDTAGRIGLYAVYRSEHPSQKVKGTNNYGFKPHFQR